MQYRTVPYGTGWLVGWLQVTTSQVASIHGGLHTIPFAAEDGGRFGAHAQAFLCTLDSGAGGSSRSEEPRPVAGSGRKCLAQ